MLSYPTFLAKITILRNSFSLLPSPPTSLSVGGCIKSQYQFNQQVSYFSSFQLGLPGKKWQSGSTKRGTDDCGGVKSQQVRGFYIISLQARRGLEITHKCSRQLLPMRRRQDSGLSWVQSSGRRGNNYLVQMVSALKRTQGFHASFFYITSGNYLSTTFQLLGKVRSTNFTAPGKLPSIPSKRNLKYKDLFPPGINSKKVSNF